MVSTDTIGSVKDARRLFPPTQRPVCWLGCQSVRDATRTNTKVSIQTVPKTCMLDVEPGELKRNRPGRIGILPIRNRSTSTLRRPRRLNGRQASTRYGDR
jgi:hypothetical protein